MRFAKDQDNEADPTGGKEFGWDKSGTRGLGICEEIACLFQTALHQLIEELHRQVDLFLGDLKGRGEAEDVLVVPADVQDYPVVFPVFVKVPL